MEETLVTTALDLSGRYFLVFQAEFPTPKIGEFDSELVDDFWQAVAANALCNLHVLLHHGRNSHHISEAIFKSRRPRPAHGRRARPAVQRRAEHQGHADGLSGGDLSQLRHAASDCVGRSCRAIVFTRLGSPVKLIAGIRDFGLRGRGNQPICAAPCPVAVLRGKRGAGCWPIAYWV